MMAFEVLMTGKAISRGAFVGLPVSFPVLHASPKYEPHSRKVPQGARKFLIAYSSSTTSIILGDICEECSLLQTTVCLANKAYPGSASSAGIPPSHFSLAHIKLHAVCVPRSCWNPQRNIHRHSGHSGIDGTNEMPSNTAEEFHVLCCPELGEIE